MRRRTFVGTVLGMVAALALAPAARTETRESGASSRDRLEAEIGRISRNASWRQEQSAHVRLGVHVVDLAGGETVYEEGADEALNPASNAKILVAAAALRELGGAFTIGTSLVGVVEGDAVRGDVVLVGHGDPTLRSEDLWTMARRVRARGIARVTGGIVVDDSYFDDERLPYAFDSQPNEDAAFRAPVGAASVDANAIEVVIGPGPAPGSPATVASYPTGFLDVDNEAISVDGIRNTLGLFAHAAAGGGGTAARVRGNIGTRSGFDGYCRRIDDPVSFAGMALREALEAAGVDVESDGIRRGVAPEGATELAEHESDPLGTWLWRLGKDSSNFHAEQLLRILGAEAKGAPGSASSGAEAVREALADMGVDPGGLVLRNGSGLFDADSVSPRTITALLAAVYADVRIRPEFLAQLSIAGVDGTAESRLRGARTRGLVRAKTGTLAAVSAFSGYALAPDGRAGYAFSIIVNDARGRISAAREVQDSIVEALAADLTAGTEGGGPARAGGSAP